MAWITSFQGVSSTGHHLPECVLLNGCESLRAIRDQGSNLSSLKKALKKPVIWHLLKWFINSKREVVFQTGSKWNDSNYSKLTFFSGCIWCLILQWVHPTHQPHHTSAQRSGQDSTCLGDSFGELVLIRCLCADMLDMCRYMRFPCMACSISICLLTNHCSICPCAIAIMHKVT